jgi:DNA-binding GntR family transcriptional regulator
MIKVVSTSNGSSTTRVVARHRIREAVRSEIVSGQARPGTKLVQQQLATRFGVSMGLVREALLELQAWGLVEVKDNRGMYVAEWDADRILETYEIREVLEGLAARRCCGRLKPNQLAKLERLARQIYAASTAERWEESTRLEQEFHGTIIRACGSHTVSRLSDNYKFIRKVLWVRSDARKTRRSHMDLVEAIRGDDPEHAEDVAREHVRIGRRLIEQRIAEHAFRPNWLGS